MQRIVIDTCVLVSALRSRDGASNFILRQVAAQKLIPLITPALFLEYEDVLKRPEQVLAHGLNAQSIDLFLSALASAAEAVDIHFQWRPQLGDPGDEMVLEAAVNGHAQALITHNFKDFARAAPKFGLRVLRPNEFLKEYRP